MRGPFGLFSVLMLTATACQSTTTSPSDEANRTATVDPTAAAPEIAADPAAPPQIAEMRYLQDPETGEVLTEVPPEVLAEATRQLEAAGHHTEAAQLAKLYDPGTGRVRDLTHAKVAQTVLLGGGR